MRRHSEFLCASVESKGRNAIVSYIERDEQGRINGPAIIHPENTERSFLGEIGELMNEVDQLVQDHGGSAQLDEDTRQIVDAALGVGFDYGVEWALANPEAARAGTAR
jgi:hypothetical protein